MSYRINSTTSTICIATTWSTAVVAFPRYSLEMQNTNKTTHGLDLVQQKRHFDKRILIEVIDIMQHFGKLGHRIYKF